MPTSPQRHTATHTNSAAQVSQLMPMLAHNAMPILNPIPFLNRATCTHYRFVYFCAWQQLSPTPYYLFVHAHYLVIQPRLSGPSSSGLGTEHQLVIPRSAFTWLANALRHPFDRAEDLTAKFDGETLTLRRSAQVHGEGASGFLIDNTSRRTGRQSQYPQQAFIEDGYMYECLLPFIEGLNNGF